MKSFGSMSGGCLRSYLGGEADICRSADKIGFEEEVIFLSYRLVRTFSESYDTAFFTLLCAVVRACLSGALLLPPERKHILPFLPPEAGDITEIVNPKNIERLEKLCGTLKTDRDIELSRIFDFSSEDGRPALIFSRKMAEAEDFASHFVAFLRRQSESPLSGIDIGADLDPSQINAVKTALTYRTTFIFGGPGTGKTRVIREILRQLTRSDIKPERIALCAPTGKAARRMQQSIEKIDGLGEAKTVHRLLGYSPDKHFKYDGFHPLPFKAIILDEISMLDLTMSSALLKALKPDCRFIGIGDDKQLPPVSGAGMAETLTKILDRPSQYPTSAEIIRNSVARLTINHRIKEGPQYADLAKIAQAALNGNIDSFRAMRTSTLEDDGVSLLFDVSDIEDVIVAYLNRMEKAAEAEGFSDMASFFSFCPEIKDGECLNEDDGITIRKICRIFEKSAILCATNVGFWGTENINRLMEKAVRSFCRLQDKANFPAMLDANLYAHGKFNGDTCVCFNAKDNKKYAVFKSDDDRTEIYEYKALSDHLNEAFAVSIHKSQGSEYDDVLIFLGENTRILSRELLYTAVTRAKSSIWLVTYEAILAEALANKEKLPNNLPELVESRFVAK